MPGFTSTSESKPLLRLAAAVPAAAALIFLLVALAAAPFARAEPPAGGAGGAGKESKTTQPEEDDFSSSPFTEYGEFNEEAEEAADTKFFQYGRFFGVSLGMGFEGVTGNRGLLWQGGFPAVDFKVHYWFDFNVALDLGFYTASHFYDIQSTGDHVDVSMIQVGLDIKYYFDTKNLSAAISFANPYIQLGAGSFSKSESSQLDGTVDQDSSFGFSLGGGLEFAVKPRKVYFQLNGKMHMVSFKDTFTTHFRSSAGLQDLTGSFFTFTGNILFCW